jgi:predicted dinucleotide-binding enzyme
MGDNGAGRTLAIIGPGKLGEAVGRLALAAGWAVWFVGSPRHTHLQGSLDTTVPGALATTMDEAATADIVLVAVPHERLGSVEWDRLDHRLVIDATNHWPPPDWSRTPQPELSSSERTSSFNPRMRLAKALNHLGFVDLQDETAPAGDPLRRTLAFATDHQSDAPLIAALLDDLGFDPVNLGPLASGRWLEPGYSAFGRDLTEPELREAIERSRRLYENL